MTNAPDSPPTAKLGDIIEAYCSRCRHNLDANVAAVKSDGAPLKVQCRTCWNIVPYKPPVDVDAKKQKNLQRLLRLQEKKLKEEQKARPQAPPPSNPDLEQWKQRTADFDIRYSKPYDPRRSYAKDAYVLHKKLGVGVVESVGDDGLTMVVLFKDARVELEQNQTQED